MLTEKQREYIHNADRRWNIKVGATRSGKTYCDLFMIPKRIRACSGSGTVVLLGTTVTTLCRNIIDPLREKWGEFFVGKPTSKDTVMLFGRKCWLIGAMRGDQAAKLQGSGIEYAYGDEITTWSREVFEMLKSRLDRPGSHFDGTCNPSSPDHWLKNFLESARGGALDLTFARPLVGDIIKSLSRNVDALVTLSLLKKTDEYTYAHSVNVTIFAVAFANFLGMPDDRLHNVGLAGLLHDYGKALIPNEILTAPRSLTFQEFEVMRSHVLLGVEKIKQFSSVEQEAIEGIAQHHEKHNGTGYPNRLSGKQIGVFGRILSLSDVYDALSSRRVYKGALAPNKALGMMYKMRGQAWAPGYVERFIKMVGIFPVGTAVELSNDHQGIVCRSNPNFPAQPCVLVARDPDGRAIQPQFVDLTRYIGLRITRSLSAAEAAHFDIPMLLGGPA